MTQIQQCGPSTQTSARCLRECSLPEFTTTDCKRWRIRRLRHHAIVSRSELRTGRRDDVQRQSRNLFRTRHHVCGGTRLGNSDARHCRTHDVGNRNNEVKPDHEVDQRQFLNRKCPRKDAKAQRSARSSLRLCVFARKSTQISRVTRYRSRLSTGRSK